MATDRRTTSWPSIRISFGIWIVVLILFAVVSAVAQDRSGTLGPLFGIGWMPDYDRAVVLGSIAALWLRARYLRRAVAALDPVGDRSVNGESPVSVSSSEERGRAIANIVARASIFTTIAGAAALFTAVAVAFNLGDRLAMSPYVLIGVVVGFIGVPTKSKVRKLC